MWSGAVRSDLVLTEATYKFYIDYSSFYSKNVVMSVSRFFRVLSVWTDNTMLGTVWFAQVVDKTILACVPS